MQSLKEKITKKQVIVLSTTIILTLVYYFTSLFYIRINDTQKNIVFFHLLFGQLFGGNIWIDFWQYIFQFAMALLLFFLVPYLIIKYHFKEDLKEYGMQVGDKKFNLIWTIVGLALLPVIFFISNSPEITNEYPLTRLVLGNGGLFITFSLIYFIYYLGYEFIFRGYLQFGLKEEDTSKYGIILILVIQTLITTLFHIGKPVMEMIPAAIIGPIFGYIVIKGKSLYPVLIFHYLLGVLTNCVIFL